MKTLNIFTYNFLFIIKVSLGTVSKAACHIPKSMQGQGDWVRLGVGQSGKSNT